MSGLALKMPQVVTTPEQDPAGSTKARPAAASPLREYRFDRVSRLGLGESKPVFAVVHSNGAFFPLGQLIGATHRFLALQAADRRSGGRLPDTAEEIAAGYVRQLLTEEPTGPYALLGWCNAGVIAYEVAQQLQAAGHAVAALVLVDSWNPAYAASMGPVRHWLIERSYGLQVILNDFIRVGRGELSLHTCLRQRNLASRLMGPMNSAPMLNGKAAETYKANKAFDEELGRKLAHAVSQYRPQPLASRVLHVRSSSEPYGLGLDRKFGWARLTDAQYIVLPGDHYTIFLDPTVDELGRCVARVAGLDMAAARPFWHANLEA